MIGVALICEYIVDMTMERFFFKGPPYPLGNYLFNTMVIRETIIL